MLRNEKTLPQCDRCFLPGWDINLGSYPQVIAIKHSLAFFSADVPAWWAGNYTTDSNPPAVLTDYSAHFIFCQSCGVASEINARTQTAYGHSVHPWTSRTQKACSALVIKGASMRQAHFHFPAWSFQTGLYVRKAFWAPLGWKARRRERVRDRRQMSAGQAKKNPAWLRSAPADALYVGFQISCAETFRGHRRERR